MLVMEATNSDALSGERKEETVARVISQLVIAAAAGYRDFDSLLIMALDGVG